MTPTIGKPPVPAWSKDSISPVRTSQTHRGSISRPSMPINLSLSDDDKSPNRSSADVASPQQGKTLIGLGLNAGSSPIEEADPLYEYFPLSVDDWSVGLSLSACNMTKQIPGCLRLMPCTGRMLYITRSSHQKSKHNRSRARASGISCRNSIGQLSCFLICLSGS